MKMPNNNPKHGFRSLRIKLLSSVVLSILAAVVLTVVCIYMILTFHDQGGVIYEYAEDYFNLSPSFKVAVKNAFLGENLYYVMVAVGLSAVVVLLYRALSKVSKYLAQIEKAVSELLDEKATVTLPQELSSMQEELLRVKSELQLRERNAKEAEQRKNDLVVYLAHDLKTPLTSVIGYLTLLSDSPELTSEQRAKYVDITLDKAQRLEELINEFFDITRFSLQNMELSYGDVDLKILFSQILDEMYPQIEEKGIKTQLHLEDSTVIRADGEKLHRVFDNLLKNAINYSKESGNIVISVLKSYEFINISMRNEGDTIPPGKLDTIFEKFYRLDSSRTSKTGGAGLGLAIAKEIVEQHGGSIHAVSTGGYTAFSVSLPIIS